MKKFPYFKCLLPTYSEKSLIEVAKIISEKLFGNLPFVGLEDYIYEEVPAVYIDYSILGFQIVLQGFGGEKGYVLEVRSHPDNIEPEDADEIDIDITRYIASLLEGTEGIKIKYDQIKSVGVDYISIVR